jgi:hypothetical protein
MTYIIRLSLFVLLGACGDDSAPASDGGRRDAGRSDAGRSEAGAEDAGAIDGGADAGGLDAGEDAGVGGCTTNEACAPAEYCGGPTCEGTGACEARPRGCERIYRPVCGCDGADYGNACEAARAGTRVASEGECGECTLAPSLSCCFEEADCRDSRCANAIGCSEGGEGTCVPFPSTPGECWIDADCAAGTTCEGERICPCGARCLLIDAPGTCM